MTKTIVTFAIATLSLTNLFAQVNQQAVELNKTVYKSAIKYNDLSAAAIAVYNIITLAPEQTNWKDTLAYIYYSDNRYVQALLTGNDILAKSDTNQNILEIVSISQQNLGLLKESLENYEKLYKLSKSIYHKYKIATLQYSLKRFGECNATIAQILDSKDNTQQVTITDGNRKQQNVSIKAAVLNINGVIALEVNQTDAAKKSFEEALKAEPTFELAKNNLEALTKSEKKGETKSSDKAATKTVAPKNGVH